MQRHVSFALVFLVAPLFGVAASTTGTSEDSSVAPWWILVVVFVALAVLIGSLVWRGNRHRAPLPVNPTDWKTHARTGYIDARWLYDSMGEDLAVWLGNGLDKSSSASDDRTSTYEATWSAVPGRLETAREHLYALEATAPDHGAAEIARTAVSALLESRAELDRRAKARAAYRRAATGPESSPSLLIQARDTEVRSSSHFSMARTRLAEALLALSTLV